MCYIISTAIITQTCGAGTYRRGQGASKRQDCFQDKLQAVQVEFANTKGIIEDSEHSLESSYVMSLSMISIMSTYIKVKKLGLWVVATGENVAPERRAQLALPVKLLA